MNQKYKRLISLLTILMALTAGAALWHAPARESADARLLLCENNTDWFDYNT